MSRFRPDGLEGILVRSFEMADFRAGVHVETIAPDLRPAALLTFLIIGAAWWVVRARQRARDSRPVSLDTAATASSRLFGTLCIGWLIGWFAWLAVSGNGRYAMPLMVLVGPLLGATVWRLPMHIRKRWLLLLLALGAQGLLLHSASPSQTWSMIKTRWTNPHPLAARDILLAPLDPDLILVTRSQTMIGLLVETSAAGRARLGSLAFTSSLGVQSSEHQRMRQAIVAAKRPVLLESYNVDHIDQKDQATMTWRHVSVPLLQREGLRVLPVTCQRRTSTLNVLQVACLLEHEKAIGAHEDKKAAERAEAAMTSLISACGAKLQPYGEREVLGDGSLVQVFREGRYIVRADTSGNIQIRTRGTLSFEQIFDSSAQSLDSIDCGELSRSK